MTRAVIINTTQLSVTVVFCVKALFLSILAYRFVNFACAAQNISKDARIAFTVGALQYKFESSYVFIQLVTVGGWHRGVH